LTVIGYACIVREVLIDGYGYNKEGARNLIKLLNPEITKPVLTNNIKKLLEAKNGGNISQMQQQIGVTYKTAYHLVNEPLESIKLELLNKLCNYFGVGPGEIFSYSPDQVKNK
jgi:DNA-binding Xre family transcriptional regulator